ncbi:MAG TPA: hypothetical protein VF398_02870 [bacterium]
MLKGRLEKRIQTRHPTPPKAGVNIRGEKYDLVKSVILKVLRRQQPVTFSEMVRETERMLYGRFDGSVAWYVVTVKLDLEARGLLQRVPNTHPETYRLTKR